MILGFTGTQQGMTLQQEISLRYLFRDLATAGNEFHHGDCVGADVQAHDIAEEFQFFTTAHPPSNPVKRAWKKANLVLEPKPYLQRNHDIVNVAGVLLATPKEDREILRSGTWSTIRYALRRRVDYYVIQPDGTVVHKGKICK